MTIVLRTVADVRAWRRALPPTATLGFVPTMGALHAGHISLMELARSRSTATIASIFVNPLQFGPNEDLAKYPRPIEKDLALLEAAGVDAAFVPEGAELYPEGASTFVVEETVSGPLCGALRPGDAPLILWRANARLRRVNRRTSRPERHRGCGTGRVERE